MGILLGTFVFEFAQIYLMQYTGQLAMFDLRKQLMAHLQGLDLAFFDRNPVGRLVTRVTTDVDVLNDLFASGLVTILGDVLVLSLIVAIMFKLSPGLTILKMCIRDRLPGVLRFPRGRSREAILREISGARAARSTS